MANLSSLTPITTAATSLSNLVLAIPNTIFPKGANARYTVGYQPQNPASTTNGGQTIQQPPALLFHYEGEQTISIESDITDHFVENNTAIQDQIALRPTIVTTHGFIGELNDVAPPGLAQVQSIASSLTTISSYTPALSTTALIAYSTAFQLYQVAQNALNAGVSAWSSLTGQGGENVIGSQGLGTQFNASQGTVSGTQNKQQTYFQLFYGYWTQRTLFTVQTPWAVFQDMAIQKLRAIQDAETNMISDFEVTFKQIRMAGTNSFQTLQDARAFFQRALGVNLGTSTPATTSLTPTAAISAIQGGG